jgi:GNAT superfamily N-acetyltransferase
MWNRSLAVGGIGDALVRACVEFALGKGYDQITLWTATVLDAARRIYARSGLNASPSKSTTSLVSLCREKRGGYC